MANLGTTLTQGVVMHANSFLQNGNWQLILTVAGDLEILPGPIWNSNSPGHNNVSCQIQNGDVILYAGANKYAHSNTGGHPSSVLTLTADGAAQVVAPGGVVIWDTSQGNVMQAC